MDEEEIDRLLAQLAGSDERVAQRALVRLLDLSGPRLRRALYREEIRKPDVMADVCQEAAIKLWRVRKRLGSLNHTTWFSYLRITAVNCYRDQGRDRNQEQEKFAALLLRVPEQDRQQIHHFESLIERVDGPQRLLDHADTLWLGLDPALSRAVHRRQVLAAQLCYLHQTPRSEILELLPSSPGEAPLTRAALDAWLSDEGVIRALAYHELFYSNDRLAWHLLGHTDPVQPHALDVLSALAGGRECDGGEGVTPEISIILWRYRYGLKPEEILRRKDCPCDSQELDTLLASLGRRLPFTNRMVDLLTRLTPTLGTERTLTLLGTPGLWQRLAFQYYYGEDLTLHEVCERLVGPAQQVGYGIHSANLNVWLSGKQARLISRLVKYCARQRGEEIDG